MKETGGAAFPSQALGSDGLPVQEHWFGMTLRDYFAAAAMQGICSIGQWPHSGDFPEIAKRSYAMADAMLAERAKP